VVRDHGAIQSPHDTRISIRSRRFHHRHADGDPVCDRFSNEEVSALFGAVKQKNAIAGPDSCTWTGENRMLTVMRTQVQKPDETRMILDVPRRSLVSN